MVWSRTLPISMHILRLFDLYASTLRSLSLGSVQIHFFHPFTRGSHTRDICELLISIWIFNKSMPRRATRSARQPIDEATSDLV